MLSEHKLTVARTVLNNWFALVALPGERIEQEYATTIRRVRAAVTASPIADQPAAAARLKGMLPDDLRRLVALTREFEHGDPAQIERLRAGLLDEHVQEVEDICTVHDLGLPPFTAPWGDEALMAWLAATTRRSPALSALIRDLAAWWKKVSTYAEIMAVAE